MVLRHEVTVLRRQVARRKRTGPTARLITSEPGCDSVTVAAGDLFVIETPGGGG